MSRPQRSWRLSGPAGRSGWQILWDSFARQEITFQGPPAVKDGELICSYPKNDLLQNLAKYIFIKHVMVLSKEETILLTMVPKNLMLMRIRRYCVPMDVLY